MGHCRLCLKDSPMADLNIEHIQDKITAVFSFEITSHPDLPEIICSICVDSVSKFYDYCCLVYQNQLKLYCQIESGANEVVKHETSTCPPGVVDNELNLPEPMEDEEPDSEWASKYEIDIKPSVLNLVDPVETIEFDEDDSDSELIEDNDSAQEGEDEDTDKWIFENDIEPIDPVGNTEHETRNESWNLEKNVIFRDLKMVCNVCQEDQVSYGKLKLHLKNQHDRPSYILCCEQKLYSELLILHHFEKHNPIVKIKKQIVDDMLPGEELTGVQSNTTNYNPWKLDNSSIYRHLNLTCDICCVEQATYQKLKVHLEKHHARHCYISCCGKSFDNEKAIIKHFQNHCPELQSKKTDIVQSGFNDVNIFATVLTDYKQDLEGYEPLPNVALAIRGDSIEEKKLEGVIEHLVQKHFTLDCELCGAKLDCLSKRQKHFKGSHPSEKYYVSCCGCRFFERVDELRHLNRHRKVDDNGASCEVIPETNERFWLTMEACRDELKQAGFIPPVSLASVTSAEQVNHLRQMQDFLIAKYLPLDCEVCNVSLSTYPERRQHFRVHHPKLQHYIECCRLKMDRKRSLMIHLLRHKKNPDLHSGEVLEYTNERKAREYGAIESFFKMDCSLCPYKGNSYTDLRSHFKRFHRELGFFITCCNVNFTNKHDILAHVVYHQKPTFKCGECKEIFESKQELEDHADNVHRGELNRKYKCDQCIRTFAEKYKLQVHLYKHKLAKCDICGIELNQTSLKRHRESIHKLGTAIICSDCPRIFYTPSRYNAHCRRVHETDPEPSYAIKGKNAKKKILKG